MGLRIGTLSPLCGYYVSRFRGLRTRRNGKGPIPLSLSKIVHVLLLFPAGILIFVGGIVGASHAYGYSAQKGPHPQMDSGG